MDGTPTVRPVGVITAMPNVIAATTVIHAAVRVHHAATRWLYGLEIGVVLKRNERLRIREEITQ
jgi:hypothetical protein